jgi:hypothetical protein
LATVPNGLTRRIDEANAPTPGAARFWMFWATAARSNTEKAVNIPTHTAPQVISGSRIGVHVETAMLNPMGREH